MAADPVYSLWHRVRAPFKVPQACHRCALHEWEVFDADKAGCRSCGRYHQCRDGGDCIGVCESDHQVCEITGCWIRTRNFQQGYTDTAMPTASTDLQLTPKPWVEGDRVMHWLHTLIFSDAARRCIGRELQRIEDKVSAKRLIRACGRALIFPCPQASSAFARVAKTWKLERRDPDILAMLAQTRFAMGSLRIPRRLRSQCEFDDLAHACVLAILGFTGNFKKVLMPHVPPAKLDHFIIGLIYLLRTGIIMFDTLQIIPRIPALRRLLPMETCLKVNFKIPCKIITEVENITKIALKALDRRRLKALLGA
jgi:hypothetical protein